MTLTTSIRSIITLTVAVTVLLGYGFISAWTAPPAGTVPPANNVPAPLHVGAATQDKNGNLLANIFAAANQMRSGRYCDALGANCFKPADVPAPLSVNCPAGQAITAISADGGATCTDISGGSCSYQTDVVYNGCGEIPRCPAGMTVLSTVQVAGCGGDDGNDNAVRTTCGGNICTAPTYRWSTQPYTYNCESPRRCGTPICYETRVVQCLNSEGAVVSDSNCTGPKPATQGTRNNGAACSGD